MADIILNVEVRERTGTGGARDTRRDGKVPGVLYGGAKDPVAIAVKSNEFRKALHTGKLLGHMVTLKYGDETQPVIAKAIDMHPVTDEPWHFDLYRVDADQQIKIEVPVPFANQEASPGLKRGGTLTVVRAEVELEVTAGDIPDHITVDLTGKQIGDVIHINDITLPAGAKPTVARNFVVANIAAPSGLAASAED